MDIKDLDKKQLILLTFLITFVVSIATGIVTVSLMNKAPKSVPQTINNVIQRTIEKVTTVEVPTSEEKAPSKKESFIEDQNVMVPIYSVVKIEENLSEEMKEVGQGVIISDSGIVLVESSILSENLKYKVVLNKINFNLDVLKKFDNGFTLMKISESKTEKDKTEEKQEDIKENIN